jgi:hypothetical protein
MRQTQALALLFAFCSLFSLSTQAQGYFPDPGFVYSDLDLPRVDISVDPDSLAAMYADPWSDHEYPADFVFTRGSEVDSVSLVGMRPRGNFSRGAAKKSFKISFNTFEKGRKWKGFEKLNLNGQHNDPSIMRAKLAWDIARDIELPASRSSHVELYINGNFHGLYISIEHYDEEFTESHFGSGEGNLYKCTWPADLAWAGPSASSYDYCEFKQGGDIEPYTDLIEFIDILNNTPTADLACELEQVFNVQDYLKAFAFEVAFGHWDGYRNKNNLYLHHNAQSGLIEYIPYDMDNVLGIEWGSYVWAARDIYDWGPSEYRPLMDRLLEVDRYRDWYTYQHRILTEMMDATVFFPEIDRLKDMTEIAGLADPYRSLDYGWSDAQYLASFDIGIGGHADFGIKQYINGRNTSTIAQMDAGVNIRPIVKHLKHNWARLNQQIWVAATVEDDGGLPDVWLWYSLDGAVDSVQMFDDGTHADGAAGDLRFGALIPAQSSEVEIAIQVRAYDDTDQATFYPCNTQSWSISNPNPALFINEFMAQNNSTLGDETGAQEDWVEIYNGGTESIYLGDKFLSDDSLFPSRWRMPDMMLEPGRFVFFWADDDEEDGANHMNFQLAEAGGEIGVYHNVQNQLRPLHRIIYPEQTADQSWGLTPDGEGEAGATAYPSPGWSNIPTGFNELEMLDLQIWPNPARHYAYIYNSLPGSVRQIQFTSTDGRQFLMPLERGADMIKIDLGALQAGLYMVQVIQTDRSQIQAGKIDCRVGLDAVIIWSFYCFLTYSKNLSNTASGAST